MAIASWLDTEPKIALTFLSAIAVDAELAAVLMSPLVSTLLRVSVVLPKNLLSLISLMARS
ncbi:MAG: hypothetical protein BWY91_02458 [bacterium ADurb.BinA028]|nr:MAG: hypothetical protein BWY91_02458 [bacterium ADurb.BinA028]